MVDVLALGAGQHGDRVAAVIFVEALGRASGSAHHAGVHASHYWIVEEAWVCLEGG